MEYYVQLEFLENGKGHFLAKTTHNRKKSGKCTFYDVVKLQESNPFVMGSDEMHLKAPKYCAMISDLNF